MIDAIHLLDAQDRVREQQLEDLRREIALGLEECERGDVAELDIEEIIGEARRQLAAKRRADSAAKYARWRGFYAPLAREQI